MKVLISNTKQIFGLNSEDIELIKKQLTIDNPAYLAAKKYSKYNKIYADKYLKFYKHKKDYLEVPTGYNIPFSIEDVIDDRIEVNVKYPTFNIKLRESQDEAARAYLADTDSAIISMPTGKGKSILGLYLASLLRQKTLIIVHKDDLVTGWKKDIDICFNNLDCGLIKAQKRKIGGQITIATIQTLNRLPEEYWQTLDKEFGMIIVDEMHHISSSIYGVVNRFHAQYKLGLSATPERSDGLTKCMHFHLGNFSYVYECKGEEKDILPVKVIVKNSKVECRVGVIEVKNKAGKISYRLAKEGEKVSCYIDEVPYKLRPIVSYSYLDALVIKYESYFLMFLKDIMNEYSEGKSIVVFLSKKEHCRFIFDLIQSRIDNPENVQLYYGDMSEKRETILNKAENNRNMITIATYSIATEGTNVKQWEVAFLLSSINNGKNVEQVVGRIRRTKEGKINPVIVYDYRHPRVYILKNHGITRDIRYRKLKFKVLKSNTF